ncbi:MAG TPA: tetratricopeptide repeat protein [Polyangiaceae bacterium]|nr:tetratricopeptide repeat protein [Polyangiaceae bacterium]
MTGPAWAQDSARDVLPGTSASVEKGRGHFQRGVELFREGDYRAALVEFKRSYESAPSYRILYNIGQTNFELQDYAGALRAFERYLAEGGADVPANRRTIVEGEIRKLQGRVARIDVEVNVAGAQITVDDAPVGSSPLSEPVLVSAGVRRIAAVKAPLIAATRSVELAGGDRTKIVLKLEDPPAPGADRPPDPNAGGGQALPPIGGGVQDPGPNRTPFWVALGVTGALGAGAAVSGLLALQANDKLQDKLDSSFPGDADSIDQSRSNLRTWSYVADGLTVATIIAAGVTVYMGFRTAKSSPSVTTGVNPPRAAGLQLGARPGGVALKLTF